MASSFHNKRLDLEYGYDSFGNLTHEYQEHGSAVDVSTTPVVQYGYADGSNNSIRPTYIIYPDGRQVDYDYGTAGGPNDLLSRIETLDDSAGSTTTYQYFGTGQVISAEYDEPDLTYSIPGGMGGYSGLDRFGRVVDLRWQKGTNSPVRFGYGYDRLGNRLFERNNSTTRTPAGATRVEALLGYDELNRLVDFKRGKLNSGNTAIASPNLTQDWTLDETGNWAGFDQGVTDALSQTRTHNTVNEITDVSETSGAAWATPAHDANGNQTSIPQPTDLTSVYDATWDAWNRLVELKDGTTTVAAYQYDGQNRRVVIEDYDSSGLLDQTIHCYLSTAAQVLEERIDSSTDASKQFVWGLRFVDDLILRDRDTNSDGTLDERLYALHDLRFSIVAVANSSGTVLERYSYDAYGKRITLAPNFTSRSSSNYAWQFGYTGRRRDDATGLYFFRARYYSAELGRFAGRDPLGFVDGMSLYRGYFGPGGIDPWGSKTIYNLDHTNLWNFGLLPGFVVLAPGDKFTKSGAGTITVHSEMENHWDARMTATSWDYWFAVCVFEKLGLDFDPFDNRNGVYWATFSNGGIEGWTIIGIGVGGYRLSFSFVDKKYMGSAKNTCANAAGKATFVEFLVTLFHEIKGHNETGEAGHPAGFNDLFEKPVYDAVSGLNDCDWDKICKDCAEIAQGNYDVQASPQGAY